MPKLIDFKAFRLKLAPPERILEWSHGEVAKPETINYRTQKPEKDGLFDERIFGPTKDWECYCGKYKRIRYKGVVCDKCGVEVTRSSVRRERMGHIKLAGPVSHIWFLRGMPSKIGLILDLSIQDLERVIYFANYIITSVDEKAKGEVLREIEREFKSKSKKIKNKTEKEALKAEKQKAVSELKNINPRQIISEFAYHDLAQRYGQVFEAGIGAEAIHKLLFATNLEELKKELREGIDKKKINNIKRATKRKNLIEDMLRAGIKPHWMLPDVIPVVPPDTRPMVQLAGGRYATADLNDLYRRVINRNNRLKKLIEISAPEVIQRNEKRMLQEAVDALIDNSSRHGQTLTASSGQRRPLRSLSDLLRGKQGRFRHNLLGKRVDYSGRSVIVVGPNLKLHQCGLPKRIALELFKPFVINKLVEREIAHNIRGANRLIENEETEVWAILEEIIQNRYVLLNRAPTLHRLGIQAFQPVLIEGSAIQLHPLVTTAFNADFDGDQMAVHLPLTEEAQKEAKELMLSSSNILLPASGDPVAVPHKDMALGTYWMSVIDREGQGKGKIFSSMREAILAYDFGDVNIKSSIYLRVSKKWLKEEDKETVAEFSDMEKDYVFIETCVGRIIINDILDEKQRFINRCFNKGELKKIVAETFLKEGEAKAGEVANDLKTIGFEYATLSGISWGMGDLTLPDEKKGLIAEAEKEAAEIRNQYDEGLLTEKERKNRVIEIWSEVKRKLWDEIIPKTDSPNNPAYIMINSGARGSWLTMGQLVGMRGLMVNPSDETIELPIKSSFKEGMSVLEYFISTHGARKGLTDTALKTATAGYLTRRLVDVAQDVVVREKDCRDNEGFEFRKEETESYSGGSFINQITGRVVLGDIKTGNKVLAKNGTLLDGETARNIVDAGINKVKIRSALTCRTRRGVCQFCYGYDLGRNQLVEVGQAVGIVTAQAIGEPGTQLTMRTFHTGGVAGTDITMGLPRIEEIFEVRNPKGRTIISEVDGRVLDIEEREKIRVVKIEAEDKSRGKGKGKESKKKDIGEYQIPVGVGLWVSKGDLVNQGDQLAEGHIDLKELLRVSGEDKVQRYVINEVQNVYATQGAALNNKHIEIIIRQMFSRYRVEDSGDTDLMLGDVVERSRFEEANDEVGSRGKKAIGTKLLMGITKVSLTTDSFLSAASFQETTRVLNNAAVSGKVDKLLGLKENVIIGKIIPAGTGYKKEE